MGKRLNMVIRALFGAGLPDGAPLATDRVPPEAGRQTLGLAPRNGVADAKVGAPKIN